MMTLAVYQRMCTLRVMRSGQATVNRSSPDTSVHWAKLRLVVMETLPRS